MRALAVGVGTSAKAVALAVAAVVVLVATTAAAMDSFVVFPWWDFLLPGHLGMAILVTRWLVRGVAMLVVTSFVAPRAATVAIPANLVGVIVVDTLPRCVSGPWRGNTFPMVGAIMVLVMGVMVVMALLS